MLTLMQRRHCDGPATPTSTAGGYGNDESSTSVLPPSRTMPAGCRRHKDHWHCVDAANITTIWGPTGTPVNISASEAGIGCLMTRVVAVWFVAGVALLWM